MIPSDIALKKKSLTEMKTRANIRFSPTEIYLQWALADNLILDSSDLKILFPENYVYNIIHGAQSKDSKANNLINCRYAIRSKGFYFCSVTHQYIKEVLLTERHENYRLKSIRNRCESEIIDYLEKYALCSPAMMISITEGVEKKFVSYSIYKMMDQGIINVGKNAITLTKNYREKING